MEVGNKRAISVSQRHSEMEYQPLKLKKEFEQRAMNNKPFEALRVVTGLELIPPDNEIRSTVINDLFPSEDPNDNTTGNVISNCEVLMVVAMYNESSEHFTNTMVGVNENLEYFNSAGVDPAKIACIIVVDGIGAFLDLYDKEKDYFKDFFDESAVKARFNVTKMEDCRLPNKSTHEQDEFAHCFTQTRTFGSCTIPLNVIFCVKHHNKRKLNSHLWFFGGFCNEFQPKYAILLDVGTRPMPGSLFYLYEAMECNPSLAGCCGEIKPMKPNYWKIVVPAQIIEYKFAHMLDKALESVIGFITVLPGAFSAYRWEALSKGTNKHDPNSISGSPLWEDYFKSICHPDEMDAFHSNIYLAEDRVLCLSLFTKKGKAYTMRYVKRSIAETDVPDSIAVLMSQRRRWINGSWFALIDSLRKCNRVCHSKHNCCRKCCFSFQMIYYLLNVIYSWFIVGSFTLAVQIAIKVQFTSVTNSTLTKIGDALFLIYISLLILLVVISLSVKPKRVEDLYKAIVTALAVYELYIVAIAIGYLMNDNQSLVSEGIGLTALGFGLIVVLNCQMLTVASGALHYILLIPTYINIFMIYSICNVHDCTWGNRPDALNSDEKQRLEEFEEFRARWVVIWVFCNSLFAYVMSAASENVSTNAYYYFLALSGTGMGILMIRVIGGLIYLCCECCEKRMKVKGVVASSRRKDSSMGHLIKSKRLRGDRVPLTRSKEENQDGGVGEPKGLNSPEKNTDIVMPSALDKSNNSEEGHIMLSG